MAAQTLVREENDTEETFLKRTNSIRNTAEQFLDDNENVMF